MVFCECLTDGTLLSLHSLYKCSLKCCSVLILWSAMDSFYNFSLFNGKFCVNLRELIWGCVIFVALDVSYFISFDVKVSLVIIS